MRRWLARVRIAVLAAPLEIALGVVAIAAVIYVVAWPLGSARYPPMTDFPFHAAYTSAFRHWYDPAFHFQDQFELHPLAVPYVSMYVLGAVLMTVLPMMTAVKVAAAVMLALLPAGLAVLFHGMKKSPLLGLAGLGLVWCNLSHWGFLNFVGALGLFAMIVGLTMMLLDQPSRGRQAALGLALVALFFTHIFRYPFAIAAVVGTGLTLAPATRRWRPLVPPLVPAVGLLVVWFVIRPGALQGDMGSFTPELRRVDEVKGLLFGGFHDPDEPIAVARWALAVAAVGMAGLVAAGGRASRQPPRGGWAWAIGAHLVPVASAAVFFFLFLSLPMQVGDWWYVYPREATAAAFVALGALPDLPRTRWVRAVCVFALATGACGIGAVVTRNYARFDEATRDFHAITRQIPEAPRLCYLVFDHGGSTRANTPFIHLPAYVQAERGGWLSFHFAVWGASPMIYRERGEPGAVVPPDVPRRWEWTPQLFDVTRRGAFFDWFLVRQRSAPDAMFRADPTIERVDHQGTWWLYRRKRAP